MLKSLNTYYFTLTVSPRSVGRGIVLLVCIVYLRDNVVCVVGVELVGSWGQGLTSERMYQVFII